MLLSLEYVIKKLTKLQREFLIDHVDGMRPFIDQPVDNQVRESLITRHMIRYEPDIRSRLGRPDGTVLTDDGRSALGYVLGDYADALIRALEARQEFNNITREKELVVVLREAAAMWREYESYQRSLTPPREKYGYGRQATSTDRAS